MITAFHGGFELERSFRTGYVASGKKGRNEFGAGLYCSVRYETCQKYAGGRRKLYALELDLNPADSSDVIYVDMDTIHVQFILDLPRPAIKQWEAYVKRQREAGRSTITLNSLNTFVNNYVTNSHRYMQALNDYMVKRGAKYSVLDGHIIRVHDFSIIKTCQKPTSYEGSEADLKALNDTIVRLMMS